MLEEDVVNRRAGDLKRAALEAYKPFCVGLNTTSHSEPMLFAMLKRMVISADDCGVDLDPEGIALNTVSVFQKKKCMVSSFPQLYQALADAFMVVLEGGGGV